ncbi:MAG: HEAT repeat domain-containing protein [Phycisphaerae bacterium]
MHPPPRHRWSATVALTLLLLGASLAYATPATTAPATQPVATSHTDTFLKKLRAGIEVKTKGRFEAITGTIPWDELRQEAQTATDPKLVTERLAYVEFWQRLAKTYDFGMQCSRDNVFESEACARLAGTRTANHQLHFTDLGLPRDQACQYLLNEDLPTWAESLRLCAAAVLVGAGDTKAMDILCTKLRRALHELPVQQLPTRSFGLPYKEDVLVATWTPAALPLWAQVARDPDPKLRLLVVAQIAAIHTEPATTVLLSLLKDDDRAVRNDAALALMHREQKAAAPVLLELVQQQLDGSVQSASMESAVCVKLQQWNIPGVPWDKIEGVLNDAARAKPEDYRMAVIIAGHCLSVGREKVALPFLQKALGPIQDDITILNNLVSYKLDEPTIAWQAAKILAGHGRTEGLDLIHKYLQIGQTNWSMAYEGLLAVAASSNRPTADAASRKLAQTIAAVAFERRDVLFSGYFGRLVEALGEMGALVRVEQQNGQITAVETLAVGYGERYTPQKQYQILPIYHAKLRSVVISAQQAGITLTPAWLAQYQQQQRAILTTLSKLPDDAATAQNAQAALRELTAPAAP